MKNHLVSVLAYDRLCTFELGCAVEVFGQPRPELDMDWYRFAVCSAERGPIRAAGGLEVRVPYSLRMLDRAQTIIIPGWREVNEVPSADLIAKVRGAYARGARLASICSGVFVLAAAGLLEGKRATTHWRYAETLAARFPNVIVEPNALYVDEGQIITAAGSAAGLDMMLHLVRADHGSKVANSVARRLVIPPHRQGNQAQYLPRPIGAGHSGRLASLMDWIRANLDRPHTLNSMAARGAMSARTLQRHFSDATGLSPYEWLIRERVALAGELLESGTESSGSVARRCGLRSEQCLRKHFRRVTGSSPSTYRRQFRR